MNNVSIGKGDLQGKGVYAARDFKKGEVVIKYDLKELTEDEFNALPVKEKKFVHSHNGKRYLYSSPERFVNHSTNPNTFQDFEIGCDRAARDIKKGELITTNAELDDF